MRWRLGLFSLLLFATFTFALHLDPIHVLSRYRELVQDYDSSQSQDSFVQYVKEQLPYLSLYRFYKIKMVGSVDKRESALDIPYFMMALVKREENKASEGMKIDFSSICGGEESFSFEFGLFTEEEEREKEEKKERECIQKILSTFSEPSEETVEGQIDFNELFARSLFLSYVEADLKRANVSESLVKHSAALTYSFNLYNEYTSADLEKVFTHVIGYYLGVIHERPPFEVEGLSRINCSGCRYIRIYPGGEYLNDFINKFDSNDVLGFKERLKVAVEELSKVKFLSSRDFEWKVWLIGRYIYEKFVKDNITRMEWTDLRKSMPQIIEHVIAYYLNGTDLVPPVKLDIEPKIASCGNGKCTYRFYRYKSPNEMAGILNISDVKESLKKALKDLSKDVVSPEEFSKKLERTAEILKQKAKRDIRDLKDILAYEAARISPKKSKWSWIRFLVYALVFIIFLPKKKWKIALTVIALIEIGYILFFLDLNSPGEGLCYSIAAFFSFVFAMLLSMMKMRERYLFFIYGMSFCLVLFLPTYLNSEELKMSTHPGFHASAYYDLLRDDLFDGAKFERKGKLMEEEIESRFGRLLGKAMAAKDFSKSSQFKSALSLAEKIVKFSDDTLRRDFKNFLIKRLSGRKAMLQAFDKIFEKYEGKSMPPSVLSIQSISGAKAAIIFMLVYVLSFFGAANVALGLFGVAAGILLILEKARIFIEYAIPYVELTKAFVYLPWSQILLLAFSAAVILKSLRGRVKP